MLLSIITINYNDRDNFDRCMKSIINSMSDLSEVELIIVDDGSPVKLPSYTSNNIHSFYKTRTSRSNRSAARNFGASKAKGQYFLFVDGDGFVEEQFVSKYLNLLTTNPTDFIAGESIPLYNENNNHNDGRLHLCNLELNIPFQELSTKWCLTYGCNVCISRDLFYNKNVQWDERFIGWGVEDIEFAYRAQKHCPNYDLVPIKWFKYADEYTTEDKQLQSLQNLQLAAKIHEYDPVWLMIGMFVVELNTDKIPFFEFYSNFAQAYKAFELQNRIINDKLFNHTN